MDRNPKAAQKPKNEELRRKQPGWGARHPECACFPKTDIREIDKIGEGQQGKVVKARVPLFGICAVKYLFALDKGSFVVDLERQAYRELVAAQKLAHHPNIVNFYGTIQNENVRDIGFVTEFMEGGNLHQLINDTNANNENGISDDEWEKYATRWAIQIARALAYCHSEKVLHRDVKPENALLSQDRLTIKLCDFGVARPSSDTPNSCNRGTIFYMAPEVFQEHGFRAEYNSSADVFSYAMFLYTLFHRKLPYIGQIDVAIEYFNALRCGERPIFYDNIPGEIKNIITDCWQTNPEDRITMQVATERLETYWNRKYPKEEF